MTHLANGPMVSLEEAQRIERETAEHLLKSRRLSLIVDLDQTIVHATVDPTVGEWISEGEAWEARQAQKASSSSQPADDSEDSSDEEDEVNPNWEALKDVKKFRLAPETFGPATHKGGKGKGRAVVDEGCLYYIKPRCVGPCGIAVPVTDSPSDRAGTTSCIPSRKNMRCMYTRWAPVLTPKKSARR